MVMLRSARPEEAKGIVAVWRESDAEPTTTDDPKRVERLMATSPEALLVAEDAGLLVGTVIGAWDGWRGGIYRLAVLPTHRRQGIGRLLVEEAVRRLRAVGAARLAAIVVEDDGRAMAFWTAIGWQHQSARARFVLNIGFGE